MWDYLLEPEPHESLEVQTIFPSSSKQTLLLHSENKKTNINFKLVGLWCSMYKRWERVELEGKAWELKMIDFSECTSTSYVSILTSAADIGL